MEQQLGLGAREGYVGSSRCCCGAGTEGIEGIEGLEGSGGNRGIGGVWRK